MPKTKRKKRWTHLELVEAKREIARRIQVVRDAAQKAADDLSSAISVSVSVEEIPSPNDDEYMPDFVLAVHTYSYNKDKITKRLIGSFRPATYAVDLRISERNHVAVGFAIPVAEETPYYHWYDYFCYIKEPTAFGAGC